jgi:hypothetical protein
MKRTAKQITEELINNLWKLYINRVPYAAKYVELVKQKGGKVVNDHIAIRTLNTHTGEQPEGIRAIKHILTCLEYQSVQKYNFKKKKLNAVHFEHPDKNLPKIFVSQLEVEELPDWAQLLINKTVIDTPYLLSDNSIGLLSKLKDEGELTTEAATVLIDDLTGYFKRPWKVPIKEDVLKLNDVSQYAAWVLIHGNSVNHFTAYINHQAVKEWPDLASTCKGLEAAGIPMKESIEGEKGSKLQQSATQAVKEEVKVIGDDGVEKITWTYAYYELAERNFTTENGEQKLFNGFLGEQAAHLFDMTKTREN